jgi:hypothetical protein
MAADIFRRQFSRIRNECLEQLIDSHLLIFSVGESVKRLEPVHFLDEAGNGIIAEMAHSVDQLCPESFIAQRI